ncbi:OmpA family protein [Novosphingobium gossypii]|uniref:OmpA family protein n=1 Tax=Novosphingobium gossypii TaxID=1604774 RepID=UPI003D2132E8
MRGMIPLTIPSRSGLSCIAVLAAALALGACGQDADPQASASAAADQFAPAAADDTARNDNDSPGASEDEAATDSKKSIIRPDIGPAPTETPAPEPLDVVVQFPAKGLAFDTAARTLIDGVLASPTLQAGGPIVLRGHSDSRGSDRDNLAASRRRAEAVRDYLVEKGVAPGRITVIAMGEGSPAVPNRKPDGTEDPEGQAKNRRVEIAVAVPVAPADLPAPAATRPANAGASGKPQ